MQHLRNFVIPAFILLAAVAMHGCQTLTEVGSEIGVGTGVLTREEADAIQRSAEDINPEQEYYIGRAVAATILSRYEPYMDSDATRYVNMVGQAVAMASDLPETFRGYRFLILDSDEINAFAAPGGFVFVTRGLLRLCSNEDELAAVLAHEVGHVQHQHGLRAIRQGRLTTAFTILAMAGAREYGRDELRQLTQAFEGSIQDITHTLMTSGYSRRLEREADIAAVTIMKRLGYNPSALIHMLEAMDRNLEPGRRDFAATHPPPSERIRDIRRVIGDPGKPVAPEVRQARFHEALGGVIR